MGVAHGASDAVHLLPPHVYVHLLCIGWGEHGLPPGTGCATVALSHIAATAVFLIGMAEGGHNISHRFLAGRCASCAVVDKSVV